MTTRLHGQTKPTSVSSTVPAPSGVLQRKCACDGTPGPTGECAACRRKRQLGGAIQTKLRVNQPGDSFEREADRVAEQVMRMPEPGFQRQADLEVEEEELLQTKPVGQGRAGGDVGARPEVPPIVHEVLHSPGQPLEPATRAFMESRFGHDFGQVRVHTEARAGESAKAVNARAYTLGQDIAFGVGQYAPGTRERERLLAHELTHVVQQRSATARGKLHSNTPGGDSFGVTGAHTDYAVDLSDANTEPIATSSQPSSPLVLRNVRPENVTCRNNGLRNPDLSGDEVVAVLQAADEDAIELALWAERLLEFELLFAEIGEPVNIAFDTILREELGLTLTDPAHFPLIRQQIDRFRRVRELLESGYLRYMCRGGSAAASVTLAGCAADQCNADDFAMACAANRLLVLCQNFWNTPDQRSATILHEPFHILFTMGNHAPNALRRADADCFESFALRVAGQAAFSSCAGHTDG
jgi:hypothetical protein